MVAAQLNNMLHFRQFGNYQWSHCIQVFMGSTA
jgi:HD superfamily phosphodiesterase